MPSAAARPRAAIVAPKIPGRPLVSSDRAEPCGIPDGGRKSRTVFHTAGYIPAQTLFDQFGPGLPSSNTARRVRSCLNYHFASICFNLRHRVVLLMPSRRAVSALLPPVSSKVLRIISVSIRFRVQFSRAPTAVFTGIPTTDVLPCVGAPPSCGLRSPEAAYRARLLPRFAHRLTFFAHCHKLL